MLKISDPSADDKSGRIGGVRPRRRVSQSTPGESVKAGVGADGQRNNPLPSVYGVGSVPFGDWVSYLDAETSNLSPPEAAQVIGSSFRSWDPALGRSSAPPSYNYVVSSRPGP